MYQAVDCLGFAGGFTLGTVRAGFELVGKRELPGGFGVPNCEANRALLGNAWQTEVGPAEAWSTRSVEYVFGNPPCSGFSGLTSRAQSGMDAKINACMWAFAEYAGRCAPQVAVFESVPLAFRNGRPLMQKLRTRLETLAGHRYDLYHVMHNAYELGGPAKRPRYFWVASRVPFGVDYPTVRVPVVGDAWDDLAGLVDTWEAQPYRRPATWWSTRARSTSGAVDGHATRTSMGIRRSLDLLEAAREVGGWPPGCGVNDVARTVYERVGKLPPSWDGLVEKLVAKDFQMGFAKAYRWDAARAGRVIIGAALDVVVHPREDRFITHREAARIMGFPDDWRISTIEKSSGMYLTWGKGITTVCGEWISTWVRNSLDRNPGDVTGTEIGDRERLIVKPKAGARRKQDDGKIGVVERSAA